VLPDRGPCFIAAQAEAQSGTAGAATGNARSLLCCSPPPFASPAEPSGDNLRNRSNEVAAHVSLVSPLRKPGRSSTPILPQLWIEPLAALLEL
jgi:hypothetical protein